MRRVLLALLAFLLLTPAAQATVLTGATPLHQQWLAESHLPQPDITITVQDRECSEWEASACYKPNRQEMIADDYAYLFENSYGTALDRRASKLQFWHELGHAADWRLDRPDQAKRIYRVRFSRIIGYRSCEGDPFPSVDRQGRWAYTCENYVPAEQFAQAYAYCANDRYWLDPTLLTEFPGYGYQPTQAQHKRVCRLLAKWL